MVNSTTYITPLIITFLLVSTAILPKSEGRLEKSNKSHNERGTSGQLFFLFFFSYQICTFLFYVAKYYPWLNNKNRCCGGVSQNDFICQQIANLFNRKVERVENPQYCSTKGAAILAAVNIGILCIYDSFIDALLIK